MSEGIPYADIVILALVAGFILLRLRSILGTKSDDTPSFMNKIMPMAEQARAQVLDPVVQVDEKKFKPKEEADPYFTSLENGPLLTALGDIKTKDPLFTATRFLQGAKAAFEMVFDAFAKSDKSTLKMLMSDAVYAHFSDALVARDADSNRKTEVTLVSVAANDISQAAIDGMKAKLTVHFVSEQITLIKDAQGTIVEGNPSQVHHVEDHWTFERDLTSKNPNWKIIET